MQLEFEAKKYALKRYPSTSNRTMLPANAADRYLLKYMEKEGLQEATTIIYNDQFGALGTVLNRAENYWVMANASHYKALQGNVIENNDSLVLQTVHPLDKLSFQPELAVLKVPKSLALFELYLVQVAQALASEGQVVCSFMTKYFTKQLLEIAGRYFEVVEQSLAWKKSRLIILKKPKKELTLPDMLHGLTYGTEVYKQYWGVFSAQHIDYATQFFIEEWNLPEEADQILDLASGNGILAAKLQEKYPSATLHLVDDAYLAIESSKQNIQSDKAFFYLEDSLDIIPSESLDLVVSNPPFHFEHDISIEVALKLFESVARCLKSGGFFTLVANKHLGYEEHLAKWFNTIERIAGNDKFIVLKCEKE